MISFPVPRQPFDAYGIVPFSLFFKDPEMEADYRSSTLRVTIAHMRVSLIAAIILIAAYGLLDPFIFDQPALLHFVLIVRFAILLPPPIFFLFLSFHKSYHKYAQLSGILGVCIAGVGFFLLTINSDAPQILVYTFPAVVMVTLFAFFFCAMFFSYAIIASAFVNAIYLLSIWTIGVPIAIAIAVDTVMATLFLFVSMAAYQKELISRQLFVSEGKEREALARKTKADARYLDWLRQLAVFLRHEVRQPIAQINSSIEIAQIASKHQGAIEPHLTSALLGTKHVWSLVERASQATDVEAFVCRASPQRTEIHNLVAEQVASFARSNSGVHFKMQGVNPVYVDADPTLITGAVGNLLANAASFATEDSTIEVSIATNDGKAAIEVVNEGPVIEGDVERLFGPFASTRASPSNEHHGLGLYMVRLIAEQHGGTAQLVNLADGSSVRASIFLPLSPAHPSPLIRVD